MKSRRQYRLHTASDRPDLFEQLEDPQHPLYRAWPEFSSQTAACQKYWDLLYEFPEVARFQVVVTLDLDDETGDRDNADSTSCSGFERVIGCGNAIPFYRKLAPSKVSDEESSLPDDGWDAVLQSGMQHYIAKQASSNLDVDVNNSSNEPNTLSGLNITVHPDFRGDGVAELLIQEIKRLARAACLSGPVVPVRPTIKSQYADVPMDEYIQWRRPSTGIASRGESTPVENLLFDPWLRKHVQLGARVVKVAPRSMVVEAGAEAWLEWTGVDLAAVAREKLSAGEAQMRDERGRVCIEAKIPGGLVPVRYFVDERCGLYTEPNVWVEYA